MVPQNRMEKSSCAAKKVYVEVTSRFDKAGELRPTAVIWEDGRIYLIETILSHRRDPRHRNTDCYTVTIRKQERTLYFEKSNAFVQHSLGRWYVEKAVQE